MADLDATLLRIFELPADDPRLRKFATWCVRNTPLADGRKTWDLLTDLRSRNVVEVAERYADGNATKEDLAAALREAMDAVWRGGNIVWACLSATYVAYEALSKTPADCAWSAARNAAWAARDAAYVDGECEPSWAAWRLAKAAQVEKLFEMFPELQGEAK